MQEQGPRFGDQGLVLLAYGIDASAVWKAPVTGMRYPFSRRRRLGYVDKRDAEGLLGLRDLDGSAIFNRMEGKEVVPMAEDRAEGPEMDAPADEAVERPKRRRAAKRVHVRVIERAGADTVLVEWMVADDFRRAWLPRDVIAEDETVLEEILESGVPYGVAWETFLKIHVTPANVARELRKRGIWRLEDMTSLSQFSQALLAAFKEDYQAMVRAAAAAAGK